MLRHAPAINHPTSVGELLQYWRRARQKSQLALANEAGVSSRHVCFLETGRAKPSREMVLLLATALDVPLRERNALLLSAGFAPVYGEASLDAPELAPVRSALDAILRQQEPFPAVVMNRAWDIVRANEGAARFFGLLLGGRAAAAPTNVLRMMFDPKGLRPAVTNWEAVANALLQRVRREAVGGVKDSATAALLDEILAHPGVPEALRATDLLAPLLPVVAVSFAKGGERFAFFSTVTTLGTPQDVTLQELRIECFFPADPDTEGRIRALAGPAGSPAARAGGPRARAGAPRG
jgi:transcriptional regulator with XRE-family HTH domain